MKKLLCALLALVLLWASALAEEAVPLELTEFLGRPFNDLQAVVGGTVKRSGHSDGVTAYFTVPDGLTARYASDNSSVRTGWSAGTVFYFSLSTEMSDFTLGGVCPGQKLEEAMAHCLAEGWTELAQAPDMLSGGLEKTVEGVKYTLGYMLEDDVIILVNVRAEKL